MNEVIITVKNSPIYKARRFAQRLAYRIFGPQRMAKFYYRIVMKSKLNLDNPQSFCEKINWYKLYYCPNNEMVVRCSDKYLVREYISSCGFDGLLSKIINVWEKPDDIKWDSLPNEFALKISNGCGYNIICSNKNCLNETKTKRLLKKWIKEKFGCYNVEPHYDLGPKWIICEKYIKGEDALPTDYKIPCFFGEPRLIQTCEDRSAEGSIYRYYNLDGNPLPYGKSCGEKPLEIRHDLLTQMIDVAKRLSKPFPFVRVDFFVVDNRLQISELTFTPSAGLKPDIAGQRGDVQLGAFFDISKLKKEGSDR